MLVRLRIETSAEQPRADEDRLSALDIRTRAAYRAFLVRVYGFEAPVEQAVWRTGDFGRDVLRSRDRMGRLRQDLKVLGLSAEDIADLRVATTVRIPSAAHALGWLYVVERHTLLAGLIRRHAHRCVGDMIGRAFNYLDAYGETSGARFRSLGEELGYYAQRYSVSAIAAGAHDAFVAQRKWYRARPQEVAQRSALDVNVAAG